jgi:diaminohydroxyphosphoribosylaminopyrimidine deaminase/5-amino-6-(5-phosphoribosylamino)uracil reductase
VTLEPCAHHGRTGPCADALIAAGIARAVVATEDPNPLVAGKGIARLRAAGVEMTTGVLEDEARAINDAFAHFIRRGRPFVTLKAALSADGYLAPPPATRAANQPHWLTGTESRAQVQRLRHASDAVLTGIGTVLADDPLLTDRTGQPRRRPLLRVVLDANLRIPLDCCLVNTAKNDLLILTTSATPDSDLEKKTSALAEKGAEVVSIPGEAGRPSIAEALKLLARRDILSALLESGPALNGAFLHGGFVDKAVLFYAPTELGKGSIPFAEGVDSRQTIERSLQRATRTTYGPDTCISGYLNNPWPSP